MDYLMLEPLTALLGHQSQQLGVWSSLQSCPLLLFFWCLLHVRSHRYLGKAQSCILPRGILENDSNSQGSLYK